MPTEPLADRLGQLRWPRLALDHPAPSPGQLWRAEWAGTASLVVVVAAASGRDLPVAAATAEVIGDDRTVVAETAHEMEVVVWASVTRAVRMFTLDRHLTDLTPASFDLVRSAVGGQAVKRWPQISDELDDRSLVRAELSGRLEVLAEAEWRPGSAGGPSISDLAAATGATASTIARELGVTPGDARRLIQGKREPNATEIDVLGRLLGSTPGAGARFDDALVKALDAPEFRPRLRALARSSHGEDEVAARRAFAGQMMAVAARHRVPGERNWLALIRAQLNED